MPATPVTVADYLASTFFLKPRQGRSTGQAYGFDAHRNQANKLSAAKKSATCYQGSRVTLVDDADGSAHKLYGAMPSSIYVIAPDVELHALREPSVG